MNRNISSSIFLLSQRDGKGESNAQITISPLNDSKHFQRFSDYPPHLSFIAWVIVLILHLPVRTIYKHTEASTLAGESGLGSASMDTTLTRILSIPRIGLHFSEMSSC